MNYLKLLTANDYNKLTNDDLKSLRKLIPELKDDTCDPREWLRENIEDIGNIKAVEMIKNKVFAGQITIKLYKVNLIVSNEEIIKKLMNEDFKFNKIDYDGDDEKISIYSTFMLEEDKYIIRLKYNNGLRTAYGHKFQDIRFIDVLYHFNEKVLEVRTDITKAKKIVEYLGRKLNIGTIEGIRVLRKHKTIEAFSVAINGHFKKMSSNMALEIGQLNDSDIIALGELVLSLDEFLLNNDKDIFIEKIESLKFSNKLTFTQAFLAGCSQIGLSVPNKLDSDLKNQALYKTLSKYLSNENGYITFPSEDKLNEVTIRLSSKINTNTVQFVSSATENEIKIIVSNIIEDIRTKNIDILEIEQLSEEIQRYFKNTEIKSIRPEYLIENFNLEEDTVIGILNGYIKNGYISEKFEVINSESLDVVNEFNSIDEIRNDVDLIVNNVDSDYEIIHNNDCFIEEYGEFINVKYNIINRRLKQEKDANKVIISKELEAQLNKSMTNIGENKKITKEVGIKKSILKKVASFL